jgi:predicted short-subunit dehydrogenase-like oxidoreductase (DUF2520 family)
MLPGMTVKPRIAIVGAGKLGTALALSLREAGYAIDSVISRTRAESRRKAGRLASRVGARTLDEPEKIKADLVWFCVPDSEVAHASQIFARKCSWRGKIAVHSSGALSSDELGALRQQGGLVASVHPLMTFVGKGQPLPDAVPFAIEGDVAAVRVARRIVRDLGGQPYLIRKEEKAAYHAWGTFASPLLTALLATTEQVAQLAGLNRGDAVRRMMPILRRTLENYSAFGGPNAFSGPIIRGDVDTVKRHLQVLRKLPAAREVYSALAQAALQYLPAKNKGALKRVLRSRQR